MAFNFPSDDYGLVYGVGFDAGPKTAAAQDGDLADTESNADGEFEIDDDDTAWQTHKTYSVTQDSAYSSGSTGETHQSSTDNSFDGSYQSQGAAPVLNIYKRTRMSGDAFAEQRPITADLDSTDEMIISMKDGGYSNEQICAALVKDGRVHYDKKTVGSRYLRIKSAVAEREEARLDDELTDWHEGEDEALLKADQLAIAEIEDAIEKAKGKRWQIVARHLHKILRRDYKYSPGSCQKRFIALKNDVATIPPELDDDPVRRGERKAARILEKLHERQVHEAAAQEAKESKRLDRDQEKLRKALEKKRKADERLRVAEEKAQIAQEQAAKRDQKARELEAEHKAQEAQILQLRGGTGIAVERLVEPAVQKLPSIIHSTVGRSTSNFSTGKLSTSKTGTKAKAVGVEIDDPRRKMTVVELEGLCVTRGLKKYGTKAILVKRISDHDSKLAANELQAMLRDRGASVDGTKQQLVARLAQADAFNSAWGKKHSGALDSLLEQVSPPASVLDPQENASAHNSKRGASPAPQHRDPKRARASQYRGGRLNSSELLDLAIAASEAVKAHVGDGCGSGGPQVGFAPTPTLEDSDFINAEINI